MQTKSNIVQGEGGVYSDKGHKFILIEPKLYISVSFVHDSGLTIEIIDIECVLDDESCLHFFSQVPF